MFSIPFISVLALLIFEQKSFKLLFLLLLLYFLIPVGEKLDEYLYMIETEALDEKMYEESLIIDYVGDAEEYNVGDKILALISHEDIILMTDDDHNDDTNLFKGKITEMTLEDNLIRVKIDIGIDIYSKISFLVANKLDLSLGK